MVRKLEVDELEGTGVIVNGARSIIEERLERLLKSETEVRLDHEYNSNFLTIFLKLSTLCLHFTIFGIPSKLRNKYLV